MPPMIATERHAKFDDPQLFRVDDNKQLVNKYW